MTTLSTHHEFLNQLPGTCEFCKPLIQTDGVSLFSYGFEMARWVGGGIVLRKGENPTDTEYFIQFPGYQNAPSALEYTSPTQKRMNL